MSTNSTLTNPIREFIASNFFYGQECNFSNDDSFLGAGIIDSTGVLQLVSFLEETYGITVNDEELRPENFDSVNNVTAYLFGKLPSGASTVKVASQPAFQGESA